ncbi:MAG: PLDc N-terminal domain-containing protein [Chitinophagaceae bacterium]
MKNMKHPAFIIGIVSIILLFVGIGMKANAERSGDIVIIISVVFGAVHWVWSILDVVNRTDMKPFQKRFWLIAVIAAPVLGGMLFYAMHQQKDKLVT